MLNDRNDKDEGQGESEYHFSDEETNYETSTESPKSSETAVSKEGLFARLNQSRRMLISLGVFIVLIFIVYKMVAPSTNTTTPTTAITPQSAAVQSPMLANQAPAGSPPVSTAVPQQPVVPSMQTQ